MQDYYDVLNVDRNSNYDEIKASYHKLALVHHPDKANTEYSADMFRCIQQAWEVLSDAQKRAEYDQSLCEQELLGANAEVVLLSDFNHIGDVFEKYCRCGSSYKVIPIS